MSYSMNVSLSLDSLCQIFSNSIDSSNVLWINSIDYNSHIYVSPGFEAIWGIKTEVIFQRPRIFDDFLVSDNRDYLMKNWIKRHNLHETDVVYYKIKNINGTEKYIRDHYFTLYDKKNKPIAAAGFATDITNKFDKRFDEQEELLKVYTHILKDKLNIVINPEPIKIIELTSREKQCAYYLLQGLTAKETGNQLFLSARTVEKHLDSLKEKFNCTKKTDLIKILLENNVDID